MKTNEKRKKVLSGVLFSLFSLFSFSEIEVGYKWYMIFSLCVSPRKCRLAEFVPISRYRLFL